MSLLNLRALPACRVATVTFLALALGPAALSTGHGLDAQTPANRAALTPELEKVRAALDKYRDPMVAVQDGYFSSVGCIEYAPGHAAGAGHAHGKQVPHRPGGMGIHFLNLSLIGPKLDPLRPQVLIYEPRGDKLELIAAEWFVPLATGVKERPTLFGQPFDGPMEGHPPVMPASLHHYDLHVWLWKPNPAGIFMSTNPNVKCPAKAYTFREQAPLLVQQ